MKKTIYTLICFFAACSLHAQDNGSTAACGDRLVVGTIGEPSVLIPMLASDSASHDVSGLCYNGLVKYDTDLTVIGDLAKSWDISPDGLIITFHLRTDVYWEDGVPFTAQDVEFGFKTITNSETPTAYAEDFRQVVKFELLDPYTFRVTYEKPFAPALSSWGNLTVLPRHLLAGKDITKNDLTRKPVGLGPFTFKEWIAGEKIVLEANKGYFEGRPYLDSYIYRFIPDAATLFLELQSGSIDLMSLTPLQYTRQTDTGYFKNNFQKFKYPLFTYVYLAFNFQHPWFREKRVRQAIAYAINKKEIIDGVLLGLGEPSTGPYVPNTWPYNPDVKKYDFNPAEAKRMLAEAGWSDSDGDGLLDRNGRAFEFTVLVGMGNPVRLNSAAIIQWRLEQIGIRMNIRVLEWSTLINEFIDKKRFEAILLGWSIGLDPDQYDIWHSSKTHEKELNFISYQNPEVDSLLEQGRRTFAIAERKKIYGRLQEVLAEDVPYVFLYVPYSLPIVNSRFKNIKPSPIGISYNINRWYVPKKLQKNSLLP
jgi:peptide/nickel transport system substrate-binding protein